MTDKLVHEDEALRDLRDELRARGHQADIVGRPDADPSHPLTVDALIEIDGRVWAVDHCLVSRPSDLPPAMAEAEKELQGRLDAVEQMHQRCLFVSYLPQARTGRSQQQIHDYYDEVVKVAEQAATTDSFVGGEDGMISAQTFAGNPPFAALAPFTDTTGSPFLGSQVEAGLNAPLTKKLGGQLKNAKDQGWPVALLLDQIPRPGGNSRTIWIASPAGITIVVQRILAAHPGIVDQVWLRAPGNPPAMRQPQIHLLIP